MLLTVNWKLKYLKAVGLATLNIPVVGIMGLRSWISVLNSSLF